MRKLDDLHAKADAPPTSQSGIGSISSGSGTAATGCVGKPSLPAAVSAVAAGSHDHKILMSSLNGIYIYDLEIGRNIFINPQYTRLTGYTLEDLQMLGEPEFFALFHPQDQSRVAAHWEQFGRCAEDEALEIAYRFKTLDGRWMWCLSRDTVLERDGQGRARRVVGTFVDISGFKAAEKALKTTRNNLAVKVRERTARLETTVTALENEIESRKEYANQLHRWSRVFMDAADPIIIEDLSGTIVDMNREAERAYSWKRNELIGKSIRSLIPSARHQWAKQLRARLRSGEEIRNWEGMRQDQQGRRFSVLLTAFPLLDESGQITFLATIAKDITQRKQLEWNLDKTQRHLRELSRRGIEVLENDRRTTAKELHDSVGASLAAIKFRLEVIVEKVVPDPPKAVAALEETISELQVAIKETKQISANLRPTILDDLGLLSTISWYTRQISLQFGNIQLYRQIEVREEDIPETLKIVIYRVLQESLHNAAKHSDATEIFISLKRRDRQLLLEVADNGRGFDVQSTLNGQDTLSGYGLASMLERAEIAGGFLTIESTPEKGTRIRMVLSVSLHASNVPSDECGPPA